MTLGPHVRVSFFGIGLFLMLGIFWAEIYFHISGTNAYILLALGLLALSRSAIESSLAGILPTALLFAGVVFGVHDHFRITDFSNYVNDSIGIITIWISVVFTIRYRKSVKNENRQREIVNSLFLYANEAITIVNEKGNIIMANPAVSQTFGYAVEELLDRHIEILVPDEHKAHHQKLRDVFMRNTSSRSMSPGIELFGQRKDGTLVPIDVGLSSFTLEGEIFVVAFILDVTKRKTAEQNKSNNKYFTLKGE